MHDVKGENQVQLCQCHSLASVPYSEVASVYSSATFEPGKPVKNGQNGAKPADKSKKPEKKPDKKPDAPKSDPKPKTLEEAAKTVRTIFYFLRPIS